MITPPFAAPAHFINTLHPQGEKETRWFIFSKGELLINADKSLPRSHSFKLTRKLFVGSLGNQHFFAAEIDDKPPEHLWCNLRTLYGVVSDDFFAIAGRAKQLLEWDRNHIFCGCCGKETFSRETERCRECSSCGHLAYPKLAPAVMALVRKENKILLARGPHFPEKFYSALAGFVDPGETLEQCVMREVSEEVGLKVRNIRYFGSQPWPLSGSLMIAFTCDWSEGEIKIDPAELVDAGWFDRANLPQLPPPLSISRILIDHQLEHV